MKSVKKKNVLYLSGSRSDYGLMKNVLKKMNQTFNVKIVLTGMHLSKDFGETYQEVTRDRFKIEGKIPVKIEKDDFKEMSNGIAKVILGLNKIFEKSNFSFVIVLGDRWEALASAIAAAYLRIPIIHIAGGDESGGIDNYNRMAISTLATFHFVENFHHKKKLEMLGIRKSRIFNVGAVAIDQIYEKNYSKPIDVFKKYKINSKKPLIITTYHSTYEELENVEKNIKMILDQLTKVGKNFEKIVLYPNSDSGAQKIIKIIENYKKNNSIHVFKNLPHDDFLGLMSVSSLLVGNSSAVFTEGMAFKIPAINIGVRQKNRIRGKNIIDCDFNINKLQDAFELALSNKFKNPLIKAKNPYGEGKAAFQIHEIIKELDFNGKITRE